MTHWRKMKYKQKPQNITMTINGFQTNKLQYFSVTSSYQVSRKIQIKVYGYQGKEQAV